MKRQSTLTNFFIKSKSQKCEELPMVTEKVPTISSNIDESTEIPGPSSSNNFELLPQFSAHTANTSVLIPSLPAENQNLVVTNNTFGFEFDIGNIVNSTNNISDEAKYQYLKNTWCPPLSYKLPYSEHKKNVKLEKRFLNFNHLNTFEWVSFSDKYQGLFCKYCVIFCTVKDKLNLKSLVTEPVKKFAKLTGKDGVFETHNNTKYHKNALVKSQSFLKVFNNPSFDIRNEINTKRLELIKENRARLIPIIKTIILQGRQNIPFRGHRDDGPLFTNDECGDISVNEGNFRELLKFRVDAGDKLLEDHLKKSSSSATYISKTIQNELINCCGIAILKTIKERVFSSKFYSVLFDETTDLSHISQMCVVLRYVYNNQIYEDFISFVNCHAEVYAEDERDNFEPILSGKLIGETVLKILESIEVDPSLCVGIGTDGCEVMVSEQVGAIQEVKKKR